MIFAALSEAALRGELILVMDGLCRWHLRKDGVVVIREVIVLPFRRRTGLGSGLVAFVRQRNPGRTLLARCPAANPANEFWRALGFTLATEGEVNEWRLG